MSKTIGDKLEASKNGLDALLAYANGVTGQDDVSIGDAVKSLADGYGQGGGGCQTEWKLLVHLDKNMTLKDVLNEYPIDVDGNHNCMVYLAHTGDAATTTGITYCSSFVIINNTSVAMTQYYSNTTGLSPQNMGGSVYYPGNPSGYNYFDFVNGKITDSRLTNTTRIFPAGNSLYYTIIPIEYPTVNVI